MKPYYLFKDSGGPLWHIPITTQGVEIKSLPRDLLFDAHVTRCIVKLHANRAIPSDLHERSRLRSGAEEYLVVARTLYDSWSNLNVCPDVFCLPTDIVDASGKVLDKSTFVTLGSFKEWDVIDRERSKGKFLYRDSGPAVVISISEWVIDAARIPPYDLFFALPCKWICSQDFADCCQEHGGEGLEFLPVSVIG